MHCKKYPAFTLAEVLITLTVIGVIAALTIPSLIQGIQNTQYVVALRKTQSVLSQAFNELKMDGGGDITYIFSNDTTTNGGNGNALNAFLSKMNYTKNCGRNTGCWYNTTLNYLTGSSAIGGVGLDTNWSGSFEKAVLLDGVMVFFNIWSTTCTYTPSGTGTGPLNNNVCASVYVDVNGSNGPNTAGRDVFLFWITQTGIYPRGTYNDGFNDCRTSSAGWGCAGKVLKEGAMNY